jgi:F-box/leucine-rich repeat protein 2/20
LKRLNVNDLRLLSDSGLVAISKGCLHLQSIRLCYCDKLTYVGVAAIISGCAKLESIHMDGSFREIKPPTAMVDFTGDYPSLECFHANHCDHTDGSLIATVKCCKNLTQIYVSHSTKLTDYGVEAIVKGCPLLEHLQMSGCKLITDNSLFHIAENSLFLTHLDVNCCLLLTDAGFSGLLVCCVRLRFLGLAKCALLTDITLIAIGANCKQLAYIDAKGCDFTKEAMCDIRKLLPRLLPCTYMM